MDISGATIRHSLHHIICLGIVLLEPNCPYKDAHAHTRTHAQHQNDIPSQSASGKEKGKYNLQDTFQNLSDPDARQETGETEITR